MVPAQAMPKRHIRQIDCAQGPSLSFILPLIAPYFPFFFIFSSFLLFHLISSFSSFSSFIAFHLLFDSTFNLIYNLVVKSIFNSTFALSATHEREQTRDAVANFSAVS